MKAFARCPLLFALIAATGVIRAEPPFDPAARAKAIAPFIDEQTVAVVHVDLARVEIDPLFDKLVQLVPEAAHDVERNRAEVKRAHAALTKARAREIYYVVGVDLLNAPPFAVIPHAESVDVDALVASLGPPPEEMLQVVKGALLFGDPKVLEQVKTIEPDVRGELGQAFEAAGDTAAQVLLLPPRHTRRVIEEMMPDLPQEVGGGPSTILTRGLLWAAVGMDVPPKTSLRVVVQSQDNEAAALREKWLALIQFLSGQLEAHEPLRDFQRAAALLTPRVEGDRVVLTLSERDRSIQALLAAITPPFEQARAHAQRSRSVHRLKMLCLGMHNYHDTYKSFPAAWSTDASGKPLLSWRVQILPFVEQNKLYEQFHLDEPWDSEHNRKLIEKMPEVFGCPASKHPQEKGLSTYRVMSGEGTVFPGHEGIPIKEIKDGTSNTIQIVEVDDDHAVIWTKPEGLPLDPENPLRGLGGQFQGGFNVAMCDGSVHFVPQSIDPAVLRARFTRSGGEPVSE
jgi:prepilin-type processing-associated H-X9-DG protein